MRASRSLLALATSALVAACAASAPRGTGSSGAAPGSCHVRGRGLFVLPDPRCTPGATDRRVTPTDIGVTICRRGYTRSVRPPESVTYRRKRASMAAYGDTGPAHDYEYDHLIPLELGGAPGDPKNLWPEPGASPNPKDLLEDALRASVCDGKLALATAQREIASDWVAAYRARVR